MSSWDDWDAGDSRPRRRRRADDDLDLRHDAPPQSGAVTGAGVVSIIMGVLFLICGGGFGMCGLFCAGAGMAARQQGNILPPEMLENFGGVLLGWGLLHLILGVCLLVGGIMTLQRKNSGRVFCLVLAAIVALLGVGQLVLCILMIADDGGGFFGNPDPDERIAQAVGGMFVGLLYIAFSVFVGLVLMNAHNKGEFD